MTRLWVTFSSELVPLLEREKTISFSTKIETWLNTYPLINLLKGGLFLPSKFAITPIIYTEIFRVAIFLAPVAMIGSIMTIKTGMSKILTSGFGYGVPLLVGKYRK